MGHQELHNGSYISQTRSPHPCPNAVVMTPWTLGTPALATIAQITIQPLLLYRVAFKFTTCNHLYSCTHTRKIISAAWYSEPGSQGCIHIAHGFNMANLTLTLRYSTSVQFSIHVYIYIYIS